MAKISVMLDDVVVNDITLTKDRTTIGRRPYNDIVIDNPTVSGEHAVMIKEGNQVSIEDLDSTNGTYIDGRAVKQQVLHHGDTIDVGKFKITFDSEIMQDDFEKTMLFKPGKLLVASAPIQVPTPVHAVPAPELHGTIKVLTGPAAGREMILTKVVTTVGKPGVSVAAITKRRNNFFVHHVEGNARLLLNGVTVADEPAVLKQGDLLVLAGTEMQFLQH